MGRGKCWRGAEHCAGVVNVEAGGVCGGVAMAMVAGGGEREVAEVIGMRERRRGAAELEAGEFWSDIFTIIG
jgi:hypothetical protein